VKRFLTFALVLVMFSSCAALLNGCRQDNDVSFERLVGTWDLVEDSHSTAPGYLILRGDSTFTILLSGVTTNGVEWELMEDGRLQLIYRRGFSVDDLSIWEVRLRDNGRQMELSRSVGPLLGGLSRQTRVYKLRVI
jgi:hypothetical protein